MRIRMEGVQPTTPRPSGGPFKRGTLFRHGRILDTSFVPGPGQRHADAPKAICRVTAIRRGNVFYVVGADAPSAQRGNVASVESLLRNGAEVLS